MQNNNETGGFRYTYSAREQAELKKIREKYIQKDKGEENKMERLRRLDAGVTQKATVVALVFGIIGTLILGIGMSLIMSDFGEMVFASSQDIAILVGVICGVVGCIPIGLAYPLYNLVTKRERSRVAPEIIRLTDELMK